MLKASEIIQAKALVIAMKQQSPLPTEIQSKFDALSKALAEDKISINIAIKRFVELVAIDQDLQTAYQVAGDELQSNANHNRKCVDVLENDNESDSSLSISNTTEAFIRKDLIHISSSDKESDQPKAPKFFERFWKKSQVD